MIADDQFSDQDKFEYQPHQSRHHGRDDDSGNKRLRDLHGLRSNISACHVQRAMRDIQDIKDPEYQRQARCDQKQHQAELQSIEQLFGDQRRTHVISCIDPRRRPDRSQTPCPPIYW